MSEQQLKAFLVALEADRALQEQLRDASDVPAVVAIAAAAGFEISPEEWGVAIALSDDELEVVVGGVQVDTHTFPIEYWTDTCYPLTIKKV